MESQTPAGEVAVDDHVSIWRYMDLPRFVSMVANGRLWFSKAAALHDDPYEGFCKSIYREMPSGGEGRVVYHSGSVDTVISVEQMIAQWRRRSAMICENARDHL